MLLLCPAVAILGCKKEATTPGGTHDMGPVFAYQTPTLNQEFQVKNTTSRAVQILGESHSCGCTSATIEKQRLEPGQATTLRLVVSLNEIYEKRRLTCTVRTDDPIHPNWDYHLSFESFPRARFDPIQVDLGAGRVGTSLDVSKKPESAGPRRLYLEIFEPMTPIGASLGIPRIVCPDEITLGFDPVPQVDWISGKVKRSRYRLDVSLRPGQTVVENSARPVTAFFR